MLKELHVMVKFEEGRVEFLSLEAINGVFTSIVTTLDGLFFAINFLSRSHPVILMVQMVAWFVVGVVLLCISNLSQMLPSWFGRYY
ncbi:unnamed protein product [Microthlaspi erraticum]|uniref:Uncharacterized protein n=1 Tax=Microthlaspi erraticum TaxID=1685480 RepID=A0A6D2J6B8_9BRAS|nr:unnamed protein product [Microthlaspi erraticum]